MRVGRILYWRLWVGYCLDRLGAELQPARTVARRWSRVAGGAIARCARPVGAALASVRPRPLTDAGLLTLVTVVALGALTLAAGLGYGVAYWMLTAPEDVLVAGVAVVVGVLLLVMVALVFGARRDARAPRRRSLGEGR
ncbi:hypothetical protein RIF23_01010 [Lipingzhangella sp. LS1_29]|uniref:Superfamily III holin-X n=1 Tax=Lipingzhangella rawalii TaxID=2055835 RepID=A0ABU2H0P3_9ACTN|nr:hypothetical protein [Lipingzhangella rawalii]